MSKTKILIADDDSLVRDAVEKILEIFGYQVVPVENGRQVIDIVDESYSVIILDINMPVMDGFATLEALNEKKIDIPVLFFTGAGSLEYAAKAVNLGAYDFLTKPISDLDLFAAKVNRAVEKRMFVMMSRAYHENLEFEVKKKTEELYEKNILLDNYSRQLEESTLNTISTLQIALEEKDQYTAGHTKRVTSYGKMIGQAMGLNSVDMHTLNWACQIHDIGKLVIDVSCIQKPGPLTPEEWARVTKHPEIGYNIIKPLTFLEREGLIVRHHHERLDGKGYPDGLTGDKFGILTKILTVADSYDAMTSMRSYKENKSMEEAIAELESCSGTQFDPGVVNIFVEKLRTAKLG
jgi:response regulator RpfG family c-di-GMP phosphodiesterase